MPNKKNTSIEEIIKDIEDTKEMKKSTTSVEKKKEEKKDDKEEINNSLVEKNKNKEKVRTPKKKKHVLTTLLLVIVLCLSLVYFFTSLINKSVSNITGIINLLTIVLFSITFVVVGISMDIKKKGLFFCGGVCLLLFYIVNLSGSFNLVNIDSSVEVLDFRGQSLTEVMNWASSNKIEIDQEYEYSDMVPEYEIISQSVTPGTKIKDVTKLVVAISEGPSPYKEIILPNMISWDTEKVIQFVEKNHLTNVDVEFVESGDAQNTVIEQSKSGNVRRDEEIKLVFSIGEEVNYDESFKLIDFTNKSKFETLLYIKQHHLGYMFKEEFSKDIKKGFVMDQSIPAGKTIKVNEWIAITLSKGPEIEVPDLSKMTTSELNKWIMDNKLKVKFSDKYDSNFKKNSIISVNYKKGDKIAQGTVVEVVLSKGQLKMPKFKTFDEFVDWANKYGIKYEEQREFSNSVKAGEVIIFSVNKGQVIKNDDVIIVKVSDGEKTSVPDLVGLTKKEAENKLNKLGLSYNFIYKASNSVAEGKVIKQSISAGSEVSNGTTITVTISSGKEKNNNSGSSNGSSGSGSSSSTTPTPIPTPTPTPPSNTCGEGEFNVQTGNNGAQTKEMISTMNPNHKISYNMVKSCPNGDTTPGSVCSISGASDGATVSFCTTITITIVE